MVMTHRTCLSIITPVRNGETTISECIQTIQKQTYPQEHIIIDGNSTDSTLEIITKKRTDRVKWLSEPDKGMYDAMNKGIRMASGDVIGILNADDLYANHRVLEKVAEQFENPSVDSCYGDLVYVNARNPYQIVRYWQSGSYHPNRFYHGWMPPHPTFFVRRTIYEKYGVFNLSLGSAADYELMLRFLLKHRIYTVYIPEILIRMRTGGVSNMSLKNRIRANQMDRKAWKVNGLKPYPWTMIMKPLRKVIQYVRRPENSDWK